MVPKEKSVATKKANKEKTKPVVTKSSAKKVASETTIEEVKIGNQIWMAKNLDVAHFRNGDPIPQAKTEKEWKIADKMKQPAWCYYDNDPANGGKYGKLYNWYAINDPRGLAPGGFHIPSEVEWTRLTDYLGEESEAGAKMKSENGWYIPSVEWFDNGTGTNSSGFSGFPGGYRCSDGSFDDVGKSGYWWSSTEYIKSSAWGRFLNYFFGNVHRLFENKGEGFSVRCLRD